MFEGKQEIGMLNELEFIGDRLFANIWKSDDIVIIDPVSGQVTRRVHLPDLWPAQHRGNPDNVLNGIAWDAQGQRLFVTGKRWPWLFEIELNPEPRPSPPPGNQHSSR